MAHKVAKPFPHAADGHTTRQTTVGEILTDVHPDHVQGLIDEGYIVPDGSAAEGLSKLAGEAIKTADLSGVVNDTDAVQTKIAAAEAGISDGHIGAPEARSIVDEHTPVPTLPAVGDNVVEADKPDLESMSVTELKEHADKEGIDLGDATKKADVLAAIQKASA